MKAGRYTVRLSKRASADLDVAGLWWRLHRREAPTLFLEEFLAVGALLEDNPEAGVQHPKRVGVRLALMPLTRYHVYYRVNRSRKTIRIIAIWHNSRGSGPPL
jgi:plasmid stabilization system protein ParE